MKKVFSYSLYDNGNYYGGNKNKYTYNMIANVLIAEKIFPDWKLIVYYDETIEENIVNFLKKSSNVITYNMTDNWITEKDKMMWRNFAIDDEDNEVVCIRDCDGWLSYREKLLLDDWIKGDKEMHIIRDHCWHAGKIGGGLWGKKNSLKLNMEEKMKEYFSENKNHKSHSGEDQDFLTKYFYEEYKKKTQVYIGQQHNQMSQYIPYGYHFGENVKRINDLIKYNDFVKDKSKYEVVEGLSIVEVSKLNEFRCGRCEKEFHVFIGDMYNILPQKVINIIEKSLKKIE
jgi:hypothetical protein